MECELLDVSEQLDANYRQNQRNSLEIFSRHRKDQTNKDAPEYSSKWRGDCEGWRRLTWPDNNNQSWCFWENSKYHNNFHKNWSKMSQINDFDAFKIQYRNYLNQKAFLGLSWSNCPLVFVIIPLTLLPPNLGDLNWRAFSLISLFVRTVWLVGFCFQLILVWLAGELVLTLVLKLLLVLTGVLFWPNLLNSTWYLVG